MAYTAPPETPRLPDWILEAPAGSFLVTLPPLPVPEGWHHDRTHWPVNRQLAYLAGYLAASLTSAMTCREIGRIHGAGGVRGHSERSAVLMFQQAALIAARAAGWAFSQWPGPLIDDAALFTAQDIQHQLTSDSARPMMGVVFAAMSWEERLKIDPRTAVLAGCRPAIVPHSSAA